MIKILPEREIIFVFLNNSRSKFDFVFDRCSGLGAVKKCSRCFEARRLQKPIYKISCIEYYIYILLRAKAEIVHFGNCRGYFVRFAKCTFQSEQNQKCAVSLYRTRSAPNICTELHLATTLYKIFVPCTKFFL